MSKNIVLIGFMGVGKSITAKHLSKKLGWPIISTDDLIVKQEGSAITDIFKNKGEAYFRECESRVVASLADRENGIIDCGGGVALNSENLKQLKKNGITFYLCATADEIYKYVKDQTHRPLLNTPNPKREIERLLAQRQPFYEQADYVIDANHKTGEQLCDAVLAVYRTVA